jgi:hypothetical protein
MSGRRADSTESDETRQHQCYENDETIHRVCRDDRIVRNARCRASSADGETMMTATGEVVKITAESIEIKDLNGKVEIYAITSETKYGTKMKPMKHGDLKMGEHVTVSFEKKNGKMVAMVINKKAKLKPANPSVKK